MYVLFLFNSGEADSDNKGPHQSSVESNSAHNRRVAVRICIEVGLIQTPTVYTRILRLLCAIRFTILYDCHFGVSSDDCLDKGDVTFQGPFRESALCTYIPGVL